MPLYAWNEFAESSFPSIQAERGDIFFVLFKND